MQTEVRAYANRGIEEDGSLLMARVSAGDAVAFAALYDAFQPLVFGIALRMLGNRHAAEDLAQAVFLKIWISAGHFRGGNLGGWLSRVTRNGALDVLRHSSFHAQGEPPDDIPYDVPLADIVSANVDGETIRSALSRLPPEQREVIELGFFTRASHAEIARLTNAPLGTVKTRIRSGLTTLRRILVTAGNLERSSAGYTGREATVRSRRSKASATARLRPASRLLASS